MHPHVGRCGVVGHLFEQLCALHTLPVDVVVVVDHAECHEVIVAFGIAHEHRKVGQPVGIFGVFHGDEHRLVLRLRVLDGAFPLSQDDVLGCLLRHQAGDDAGNENHDDDAVEHLVVKKKFPRCHLQSQSHHYHGDGACRMGGGEAEHQVPRL